MNMIRCNPPLAVIVAAMLALPMAGCSSPGAGGGSPSDGEPGSTPTPSPTPPPSPTAGNAATPVPAAAGEDVSPAVDTPISASTRRGAAGLPEPLPDYASWPLRQPVRPKSEAGTSPHLPQRQAYIHVPPGKPENTPDSTGVIVVLEEKRPGDNFIAQICTLEKTDAGWKPAAYGRLRGTAPFAAVEAAACSSCHQ